MNRPTGWAPNPQAMATVSKARQYTGHEDLGQYVDTDTYITPQWILDHLGKFDLDPCAADSCPTRCAPASYLKADDGLGQPWHGRVFMNPPFSNTVPWLERHANHGEGISLVKASIESQVWRRRVWVEARGIFLLHGRTRFCRPDGSVTTGRPLGSIALVAWSAYDLHVLEAVPFAGVLLRTWQRQ